MLNRILGMPLRPRGGVVRAPRAVLVARAKGPGGKKKEVKEKKVFIPPCTSTIIDPARAASKIFHGTIFLLIKSTYCL